MLKIIAVLCRFAEEKMYGKTRDTYHKDEDASPDRCFLVNL
jgi:hypothetical protein